MRTTVVAPQVCRDRLAELVRPRDPVRLLASPHIVHPCTVLWFRPLIILPADMCRSADELSLSFSLRHELAHVTRGDMWRWLLANLFRTLFFYHPLAWLLRSRLRLYQDYLADLDATAETESPEDYAEFLTTQVLRNSNAPAYAGLGIGGKKSDLYRRIVMIVDRRRIWEKRTPLFWTIVVAVIAVVGVIGVSMMRPSSNSEIVLDPNGPFFPRTAFADSSKPTAQAETSPRPKRILTGVQKERLRYGQRDFSQWKDVLETDLEPATRLKASRALEAFGVNVFSAEAVQVISGVLKGDQPHVVGAACQALASIGATSVDSLTTALQSKEAHIRQSAANGLAGIGSNAKAAVPSLVKLLSDKNQNVQRAACHAIDSIGESNDAVFAALLPLLNHKADDVRLRAGLALGRIGPTNDRIIQALDGMIKNDFIARKLLDQFAKYQFNHETMVPVLTAALDSPDGRVRYAAIERLAQVGPAGKPAIGKLKKLLNDKNDPNFLLSQVVFTENVRTIGDRAAYAIQRIEEKKTD